MIWGMKEGLKDSMQPVAKMQENKTSARNDQQLCSDAEAVILSAKMSQVRKHSLNMNAQKKGE